MPVPMWSFSDNESSNGLCDFVPSREIWDKFNLDAPLAKHEIEYEDNYSYTEFGIFHPDYHHSFNEDTMICSDMSHDCMWEGRCIGKWHKQQPIVNKVVDNVNKRSGRRNRRSLLISHVSPALTPRQKEEQQKLLMQPIQKTQSTRRKDTRESDGDSTRSDSDGESTDSKYKSTGDKLCEWLSYHSAPVSEVTGQLVRTTSIKKEEEEDEEEEEEEEEVPTTTLTKETEIRNTLSDHSYHINEEAAKRLESMGVQTPSDSEEEIDVVSYDKPSRPATQPRHHQNTVNPQTLKITVNTALTEKPTPRPRGRPPLNSNRKRPMTTDPEDQRPAKRVATVRTTQKKPKALIKGSAAVRISTSQSRKRQSRSVGGSDDEFDADKRSLHNNMERQRRVELRNAFDDLRRLVPEIEAKEKAPKVAILRHAASYCDSLKNNEDGFVIKKTELKNRQDKLRAKVSYLRRSLALTR